MTSQDILTLLHGVEIILINIGGWGLLVYILFLIRKKK